MRIEKKHNIIVLVFVMASFLLLTMSDQLLGWWGTPKGTVFTFAHNYTEDYFYYLHIMRQAYDGAWSVTSRMTPETFVPQVTDLFFVVLGRLDRIMPIGLGMWYLISRVVGAIALMALIYRMAALLFSRFSYRLGALIVTIMGTFIPVVTKGRLDVPVLVGTQWTELDPLNRLSFVPHHLWSKVVLLWILLQFISYQKKQSTPWKAGIAVCFGTLVMGFVSPVIIVTYLLAIGMWMLYEIAVPFFRDRIVAWHLLVPFAGTMAAAGIVVASHWWLSHSTFPWTTYGPPWENNWYYLTTVGEYAASFGIVLPFAVIGAIVRFRSSSFVRMLTSWMLSGWLLIFVLRPFLPFSNSRYFAGYEWIAVGLLAAVGVSAISEKLVHARAGKVFGVLCAGIIFLSIPSWVVSIRNLGEFMDTHRYDPQYHTDTHILDALGYLNSVPAGGCIVAAPNWLDTMVPAYTSCRSVSGHRLMTWANDIKVYEQNKFFYESMPAGWKQELLRKYSVTYVVTLDGITGTDFLSLLTPQPVFTSGTVHVYAVK